MWKTYGTVGQATDDNIKRRIRFACWVTNAIDTHSEYVRYSFCTVTIVTRRRLSVMLQVNFLRCLGSVLVLPTYSYLAFFGN